MTASSEDWWLGFTRPRYPLVDPQQEGRLGYADRTTAAPNGAIQFTNVHPGDYYLYARVLWATSTSETTFFGGGAWIATATVAARETARVTLRMPWAVLPQGTMPARRFPTTGQVDPSLP